MQLLQSRPPTAAPHVPAMGDITGIFSQVLSFVEAAVPKLVGLAYFLIVVVVLIRLFRERAQFMNRNMLELVGLGILFALMR